MTKNQYMRVQAVVSIYVHPTCYFMMSYALYYIHIHIFKYFHLHFLYMYMFKGNNLINIIYLLFIYTLVSFLHNHDRAKKTQWEALGFPLNEVRRCFRAHLVVATMFASPNSCWSVPIALDAYSMDVLCSYALATFEYHPSLLIYDYVKSKYIYISLCNHYYFIPFHIAIHLDARSSGQCALRCQAGGVWVENWHGGMFPFQAVVSGAKMAYFSLHLKSKGSPWSSKSTRMFCSTK